VADIEVFVEFLDFIIDHNNENSREMVRNLRNSINIKKKNGEIFGAYEDNLHTKIMNLKCEKIKKIYMNKI
jgi:hypothetical protein